jgi:molecular chaperone DnaK (HSP70)
MVKPQDCIVFTHFDSASSCEEVDFKEIAKIEIVGQARKLLNSIIGNMKRYLARRGQKLDRISNIVLLGGSKDPINQSILDGIEQPILVQNRQ